MNIAMVDHINKTSKVAINASDRLGSEFFDFAFGFDFDFEIWLTWCTTF